MNATAAARGRLRLTWVLVPTSAVLNVLLLTTFGPAAFRIGVAAMTLLAATCMAVGDVRTGKLRNAWTIPLASAALLHVLMAIVVIPGTSDLSLALLVAVGVNFGVYLGMGLAGWVGFGDVKFVIGLTLVAGVLVGRAAMLLPLAALLIAAVARAASLQHQNRSSARPHGPALACAFALVVTCAWSA